MRMENGVFSFRSINDILLTGDRIIAAFYMLVFF